jgi:glycosyltransferase involved in cell wall biosynthesis
MRPLVSVIIPVFNRAEAVIEAVRSVANQSFTDWEIIVVDDCSSETLPQEDLDIAAGRKVRIIRHEKNQGAGAARNTGIHAAAGHYISFLDSDDEWAREKLNRQMAIVTTDPDPGSLFCVTQTLICRNGRTRVRPERAVAPDEDWGEYLYVADGFAQTNSFLLSRELAQKILFAPNIKHQDHLFFLRAGALGARYRLIMEPLNIWHNDSRSDRISMSPNLERSRRFLAEATNLLTEKARTAFLVRYLGAQLFAENPVEATKLFAHGLKIGAVSYYDLMTVGARCVLSERKIDLLKQMLGKV